MKHGRDVKIVAQRWIIISILAILPMSASGAVPQQINYQGYLTDALENPLDGDYTMVFSIYNLATGGQALWSEQQTVHVINGIYNVQIGQVSTGNPFPGDLFEGQRWLGVTVGLDNEMIPRQVLTCTPFAMRAEVAETVVVGSVSTVHIADNAVTGDKLADDAVSGAKIADGTVTASDISDGSGSGLDADLLDGKNASEFQDRVNGFCPDGSSIQAIKGDGTVICENDDGLTIETDPTVNPAVKDGVDWTELSGIPTGFADGVDDGSSYSAGTGLYLSDTTFHVQVPLELESSQHGGGILVGINNLQKGGGYGVYGRASYAGGVWDGPDYGAHYGGFFQADGFHGRGVYGVATNTHPDAMSAGGYFENLSPHGAGVAGYATRNAVVGVSTAGTAVVGASEGPSGGSFTSSYPGGHGVLGWASSNTGINYGGRFTAWGTEGRGVYGVASSTSVGEKYGGYFEAKGSFGRGVYGLAMGYAGRGVYGRATSSSGYGGYFEGRVGTDVLVIRGGSDLAEPFDIADRSIIKPGMVVSIDPEHPGQLRIAGRAYDRTVAGIVSGANGIKPGLTMSQEGTIADGSLPVALTGRVYAWAETSNGPIEPGDLLTTSNTPGHAMKVTEYEKAHGAVLGKAMTGLKQGKGLVLVLVALQ